VYGERVTPPNSVALTLIRIYKRISRTMMLHYAQQLSRSRDTLYLGRPFV